MLLLKKYFIVLLVLSSVFATCAVAKPLKYNRVLFIGNSFTYYNNSLHTHVGNMLRSVNLYQTGKTRLRALTLSGSRLIEHKAAIKSLVTNSLKPWDLVIMHGHSSSFMTEKKSKNYQKNVIKITKYLIKNDIQPALLMTWAYKNKQDMLKNLSLGYTQLAKKTKSIVVPAGLAFDIVNKNYKDINLYSPDILSFKGGEPIYRKDIKHPSVAGTYLVACIVYTIVTGNSPQNLPYYASLEVKTAKLLQKIAYETTKNYQTNLR